MNPVRHLARDVRAAAWLAAPRPAYAAGGRAALATAVPLIVAALVHSSGGTWMSLAGFNSVLADRGGGPFRTRTATLSILAAAVALSLFTGTLAGTSIWLAIPLAALFGFACSMGRVWGNAGASVGNSTLAAFAIALAYPSVDLGVAASRAGFAIVGVLWTMSVVILIWPMHPYLDAQRAVADVYRNLADYVDQSRAARGIPSAIPGHIEPSAAAAIRTALEQARSALAAIRRGRAGETPRGERLLVLSEMADQLTVHLVALADIIETIPREHAPAHRALESTMHRLALGARKIAGALEAETDLQALPEAGAAFFTNDIREIPHAVTIVDRLAQILANASTIAAGARPHHFVPASGPADEGEAQSGRPSLLAALAKLQGAFSLDSVVLRHAVRVGIVTAFAVAATYFLHIRNGYWVTITAIVILQPYSGATTWRALQRVGGTVAGAIVTALLGAAFHDHWAILVLTFVLSGVCVALLPVNYAAYSAFLTPTFVLLAESNAGDWHLASVRVTDTLLGAAVALVGARVLWPTPEWSRLPRYMAAAMRTNRDYLATTIDHLADRTTGANDAIRKSRRRAGLAVTNAEESFQRLIGEYTGSPQRIEAAMALLTYLRRLIASTAALSLARQTETVSPSGLDSFASRALAMLDNLAVALEERTAPPPLPAVQGSLAPPDISPLLRERLDRLDRQIRTLHDVVARIDAAPYTGW